MTRSPDNNTVVVAISESSNMNDNNYNVHFDITKNI